MMINFNDGVEQFNEFLGSERKTTILYNGVRYMLKYPDPVRQHNLKDILSYKNNQYSEHIGSSIFRACGFNAQETCLGYFTDPDGKKKIVVGCKDFTQDGSKLFEISKLANQTLTSEEKLTASIENVLTIINTSPFIKNKKNIIDNFWDMFVIDALIGNKDRHFGNWGILLKNGKIDFAPIYDCGSSLAALIDDEQIAKLLSNLTEFKSKEYNVPSVYYAAGKRIFYHEIFRNPPNDLIEAIKRVTPKIDMIKISEIVDSTPIISETRKEYLKKAMNMRYEQILLPALKRILQFENDIIKTKPTLMERLEDGKSKAAQQEKPANKAKKREL